MSMIVPLRWNDENKNILQTLLKQGGQSTRHAATEASTTVSRKILQNLLSMEDIFINIMQLAIQVNT
jgi:hypothetical protein